MSKKQERLKAIQVFINEYWESLDKEGLLMDILEKKMSADELHQLMKDQHMSPLIP